MKNIGFDQLGDFLESQSFVDWVKGNEGSDHYFWEQWLKNNPQKKELVDEAIELIKGVEFRPLEVSDRSIDSALEKLNQRIDREKSIEETRSRVTRVRRRKFIGIAASIVLLLTFGAWFFYAGHPEMVTYTTGYGEWKTITLPDGSVVKLNANSELQHLKDWNKQPVRMVWLKGEAYFGVQKMMDIDREFKVITKDLGVEVLGTSFNVHARGQQTQVFLEEGKIKLDLGDEISYMEPGDLVVYSGPQSKVLDRRKKGQVTGNPGSWTEGVINLKDAYALDIFERLEEIYGVEIRVRNEEIFTRQYWVQLPMEELKIVIPILEKSMKVKITRKENTLYLE
ncbi:MAG: FecR family protein [Saprospiraceae bacterium]|nr:FecR family protein [Saprospiraceae bacterium]